MVASDSLGWLFPLVSEALVLHAVILGSATPELEERTPVFVLLRRRVSAGVSVLAAKTAHQ